MANRRLLSAAAIAMSAALLVTACGGSKPNNTATQPGTTQADPGKPVDGGTLTVATGSDIVALNPLTYDDTASGNLIQMVFAPLYDINAKGELIVSDWSLAAEPYKLSADNKTYTIKLKPNAKWTDGSPVTAEDVAFTFNTIGNKAVGSSLYSYYSNVKAATAVDANTVSIELKEPDARFELNTFNSPIAPAKVFKGIAPDKIKASNYGKDPKTFISNGAYKWTEVVEKQYDKLERDANYWGKKPNVQTMIFKIYADQNTEVQALLKGEVDLVEAVPVASLDAVKANSKIQISEAPGPMYDYIGFNFNPDNWPGKFVPFAGTKTRQAINYAINRKGMVDSVLKGHGTLINGPFLPGSWADTPEATKNFAFDPATAKQLLTQDGWKAGTDGILAKNGHKFEFDLITNANNKRRVAYAQIVQQNLQDVGIKVNLKPLDFSALIDQYATPGKYQAMLLGWQLGLDPDGESILSGNFLPPTGQNSGWYKNAKTDALWSQGWKTTDKTQRKAVYADILKEFANDPPYVFIAQQNGLTALSGRVHFAQADAPQQAVPYGYFFHINNWWVTK